MIIIPMAGMSSRFYKAGYTVPKWMLPLAGCPLFTWSLKSFERYFQREKFLIIYLQDKITAEFLQTQMQSLGIQSYDLIGLNKATRGQAETVAVGLQQIPAAEQEEITIFNIDTIRPGYQGPPQELICDGWIECVVAEGDHWSFVEGKQGTSDVAERVVEKRRISSNCSTGMYYFSEYRHFYNAYQNELAKNKYSELYIAPLYQNLIDMGKDIRFSTIDANQIYFSGTPSEYEALSEIDAHLLPFSKQ